MQTLFFIKVLIILRQSTKHANFGVGGTVPINDRQVFIVSKYSVTREVRFCDHIDGGGGHSHMSVYIKCLSLDPLFYANLTPNDLFFIQSTPNDPIFSTFVSNFTYKLQIFAHI